MKRRSVTSLQHGAAVSLAAGVLRLSVPAAVLRRADGVIDQATMPATGR